MNSLGIKIAVTAFDDSWTATWQGATGAQPHEACAVARKMSDMAGAAATGAWGLEQVKAVVAEIGRTHPQFDPPVLEPVASRNSKSAAALEAERVRHAKEAEAAAQKNADQARDATQRKIDEQKAAADKKTEDAAKVPHGEPRSPAQSGQHTTSTPSGNFQSGTPPFNKGPRS